jgi:hypothetical protein
MKAEWLENMDRESCLCCGNRVDAPVPIRGPEHATMVLSVLEAIGFTREMLLTAHRHQIDYQCPGLSTWLEAQ